jgi:hypothetical protein
MTGKTVHFCLSFSTLLPLEMSIFHFASGFNIFFYHYWLFTKLTNAIHLPLSLKYNHKKVWCIYLKIAIHFIIFSTVFWKIIVWILRAKYKIKMAEITTCEILLFRITDRISVLEYQQPLSYSSCFTLISILKFIFIALFI